MRKVATLVLLSCCGCGGDFAPPEMGNDAAGKERAAKDGIAVEDGNTVDPYLPLLVDGHPTECYRFSREQLTLFEASPLEKGVFIRYVEKKWPLDRLLTFCAASPKVPPGTQNLVAEKLLFGCWEIPIHKGKPHEFTRIYAYVSEAFFDLDYYGEAGRAWRRWTFSLNVERGDDRWVLIDVLPNDLMVNSKQYLTPSPTGR